ncbi:(2Fe-2S) ferredoxin domain-containing protein [Vallitalea pronyensis]|uniref:(2Fe-2S) ferredoxin domain-containing protein n=1 Tax=Vallitalea pronyensis TaxID=1348613 RepID=A0A8J8MJN5_9FIRM|nr:(2Fe-2S) ferredoxin domain-containing protein [Vallitalea pronyensis]QUI22642.1 (2Fe-2S) ferredoxin domain-containing protein [Vallitalea pronyensis]
MLTIHVCIGSACHLKGSYSVITLLQDLVKSHKLDDQIEIKGAFCLGRCTEAVSVQLADTIHSVNPDNAEAFFHQHVLAGLTP